MAKRVFISYSHEDEKWKDLVVQHLGVPMGDPQLQLWDDGRIPAGATWLTEIEDAIQGCEVALLLISADFLASEFIREVEVSRLLERRKREGVRVIPVILRPCAWQKVDWLTCIQVRPKQGKPLASMQGTDAEEALAALAREVAELVNPTPAPLSELRAPPAESTTKARCQPEPVSAQIAPGATTQEGGRCRWLAKPALIGLILSVGATLFWRPWTFRPPFPPHGDLPRQFAQITNQWRPGALSTPQAYGSGAEVLRTKIATLAAHVEWPTATNRLLPFQTALTTFQESLSNANDLVGRFLRAVSTLRGELETAGRRGSPPGLRTLLEHAYQAGEQLVALNPALSDNITKELLSLSNSVDRITQPEADWARQCILMETRVRDLEKSVASDAQERDVTGWLSECAKLENQLTELGKPSPSPQRGSLGGPAVLTGWQEKLSSLKQEMQAEMELVSWLHQTTNLSACIGSLTREMTLEGSAPRLAQLMQECGTLCVKRSNNVRAWLSGNSAAGRPRFARRLADAEAELAQSLERLQTMQESLRSFAARVAQATNATRDLNVEQAAAAAAAASHSAQAVTNLLPGTTSSVTRLLRAAEDALLQRGRDLAARFEVVQAAFNAESSARLVGDWDAECKLILDAAVRLAGAVSRHTPHLVSRLALSNDALQRQIPTLARQIDLERSLRQWVQQATAHAQAIELLRSRPLSEVRSSLPGLAGRLAEVANQGRGTWSEFHQGNLAQVLPILAGEAQSHLQTILGAMGTSSNQVTLIARFDSAVREASNSPPSGLTACLSKVQALGQTLTNSLPGTTHAVRAAIDSVSTLIPPFPGGPAQAGFPVVISVPQSQPSPAKGGFRAREDSGIVELEGRLYPRCILHANTGIELVLIAPALESPTNRSRFTTETHLRKFSNLKPFYIGRWEVSWAESGLRPREASASSLPNYPVTGVPPSEIAAWCGTNDGLRLPSDAEWEFVARDHNYVDNKNQPILVRRATTKELRPVGLQKGGETNSFGCFGMDGNASEVIGERNRDEEYYWNGPSFEDQDNEEVPLLFPGKVSGRGEAWLGFRVAAPIDSAPNTAPR